MARRLPPSSSSSLTILSHLLARALDEVVASAGPALRIRPRFFEGGWGNFFVDFSKDELVSSLSKFEEEKRLGFGAWLEDAERGPVLDLKWTTLESGYRDGVPYELKEASFESPAALGSPALARALPEASRVARARLLTPAFDSSFPKGSGRNPPMGSPPSPALYVHLAGTGDHGFDRRLRLGAPLLVPPGGGGGKVGRRGGGEAGGKERQQQRRSPLSPSSSSPPHSSPSPSSSPPSSALSGGIATLALESPFYGGRRPPWQSGAKLARVSDLIALGRATIEEALALLRWAAASGFGRAGWDAHGESGGGGAGGGGGLGVTGLSMGGVHAAMVAALAPGPLAAVPMLAPRSAAAAFCRGALWRATAWEPLVGGGSGAGGRDNGEDDERAAVFEALLAAAAAAPPGSAARRVSEALAEKKGWPLSAAASSGSSASSSAAAAATAASASAAAAAREALEHVLEAYTDVTRFPPPPRRDAAIIVGAESDAYVSKSAVEELARHWGAAEPEAPPAEQRQQQQQQPGPGPSAGGGGGSGRAAEVRWVPGGHVSAFLSQGGAFRSALRDAMERLALPAPPAVAAEEAGAGEKKGA